MGSSTSTLPQKGDILEIDDIREASQQLDYEICGYFDGSRYIFLRKGYNLSNRGSCDIDKKYTQQWLTHDHTHPFYPSPEDILKVVRYVELSIIFSSYGFWTIYSDIEKDKNFIERKGCEKKLIEINDWFGYNYTVDNRGRKPLDDAPYDEYTKQIEVLLEDCGICIDWTPY